MSESCRICEGVMSHIWMSHVTHIHESCHTYEWVMTLIWVSHSPFICDQIKGWVMSNILSHGLAASEANDYSRQTVVSHISDSFICDQIKGWVILDILSHGLAASEANDYWLWMSHVTHINESCHAYEWVTPDTWMSYGTSIGYETTHSYKTTHFYSCETTR